MLKRGTTSTIIAMSLLGLTPADVNASSLSQQEEVIRYWIHQTRTDASSLVTFALKLSLTKSEVDGDWIGWEISSIEFREPGENGNPDTVWVESNPDVPSVDGLWWVEHADVNDPQREEFVLPPHLDGTAAAQDPNDDDLDYDFEGFAYTPPPPPGEPPYAVTAALDHYFALAVWPPIVFESGEREPVDVPPEDEPGTPS